MMIRVIDGGTTIARFTDIGDLAANFRPRDGRWQDYWYLIECGNRWASWKAIRDQVKAIERGS